jgi:xanthine dehydrogenase accessory factor
MKEIFQAVSRALAAERPVALVTVIRSIGSTPRHAAAKMVVEADGSHTGSIGGGSMERQAIQDACGALSRGQSDLFRYSLIGKTPNSVGLCGGTQEVLIDVLNPPQWNGQWRHALRLFDQIVADCEAGKPAALVTVVHSEHDAAWPVGQKMLVRHDGSTALEPSSAGLAMSIVGEARKALQRSHSVRLGYKAHRDKFKTLNSVDREPLEVFVDVIEPRSELLIVGAGHIGLALAGFGQVMGMRVVVVDDRPEWAERFPDVDEMIVVPYDPETETLDPIPFVITPSTRVVVATWGWDEPALEQVLNSPAPYIALVASRRKAHIIFQDLLQRGISKDVLSQVRVPAGLDLGAETPEEIALSIVAEMLVVQRDATCLPLLEVRGHPLAQPAGIA